MVPYNINKPGQSQYYLTEMKFRTLTDLLEDRRSQTAKGITFIESGTSESFLSYADLHAGALKLLGEFQRKGLVPGDEIVILVEDNRRFLLIFWAAVLGGIIPIPLSVGKNEEHRSKIFHIWSVLKSPWLITTEKYFDKLRSEFSDSTEKDKYDNMAAGFLPESVLEMADGPDGERYSAKPDDIAFVQFSSGSTGNPKGVVVTHRNLLANVAAIASAAGYCSTDSMLSWMPLTHDMGIIGFHINPLYSGIDHYLLPTSLFIRRPAIWIEKASEHQVTVLCSPNFGYKYFLKHYQESNNYAWDLNAIRIIYNGAEPVSDRIAGEFLELLAGFGLMKTAMVPTYGLAEATLAVSISPIGRSIQSLRVDRNFLRPGNAVVFLDNDDNAFNVVNLGRSVECCDIRVCDDHGQPVNDGIVGHIKIKGESVISGYYNNEDATKQLIDIDGWLKTGDLGFITGGELFITGRQKELIFVNGQNYYANDLERVAQDVEGVELNKVVFTGLFNNGIGRDEIIGFLFNRDSLEKFVPTRDAVKAQINLRMGLVVDKIIPVREIPRTTSGKLQRYKLQAAYLDGLFADQEKQLKDIDQAAAGKVSGFNEFDAEELQISQAWAEVLNLTSTEAGLNFFEAGGNSLRAAELAMMLSKKFHVELTIKDIYGNPTISFLASLIRTLVPIPYISVPELDKSIDSELSPLQLNIYHFLMLNKNSVVYNIPLAFRLKHRLDPVLLEYCVQEIIGRHDALRMSFHGDANPVLRVKQDVTFKIDYNVIDPQELVPRLKASVEPFDLTLAPLFRMKVFKTRDDEFVLFVDFHHLIADGISVSNFIRELFRLYRGDSLKNAPVSYYDYVAWDGTNRNAKTIELQKEYWTRMLTGSLSVLSLPSDRLRPPVFSHQGSRIPFSINKDRVRSIRDYAKLHNVSLHSLLFSVYSILLAKLSGQDDIMVGLPVSNRNHADARHAIGMFVNSLPINTHVDQLLSFDDISLVNYTLIAAALEHKDLSFSAIAATVNARKDGSRNMLFDTMFIYQNMSDPSIGDADLQLEPYFFDPGTSKYDLSLEITESGDGMTCFFEYCTDIFETASVARMVMLFEELLKQVLLTPGKRICDIALMPGDEEERQDALPHLTFSEETVVTLFNKQATLTPRRTAVEFGDESLTFMQLLRKANGLAGYLRSFLAADSNRVIGLFVDRSPELIVGILGILKASAIFLPIDTDLPPERILQLIGNSNCTSVVVSKRTVKKLQSIAGLKATAIVVDEAWEADQETGEGGSLDQEAYILYTSGSTGAPKGVVVSHRSLANYICWAGSYYLTERSCSFPLFTSVSFDLTITSIFTPLITGGTIVIYENDAPESLLNGIITDQKTDIIKLTPSHLKLVKELGNFAGKTFSSSIKTFIVGGEELDAGLARDIHKLFGEDIAIYNEYGPTEATVGCMIYRFDPADTTLSVPIGRPIANTRIDILDKFLKPVLPGVSGEIFISGYGLAKGYHENAKETDKRFITHPGGFRMYQTGDLARRLPSGDALYLGRKDRQVKINGHRIEVGEIEFRLLAFPGISEAVVSVNRKGTLSAFFKLERTIKVGIDAIRDHLKRYLPHYMIPVQISQVPEIPLTVNGKVDEDALYRYQSADIATKRSLPVGDLESTLLGIFRNVLAAADVGTQDDFFEYGGDSIKAVQIASRAKSAGVRIKPADILRHRTIRSIAQYADYEETADFDQGFITGTFGFKPIDKWFFDQKLPNPNYYNQSVLVQFKRPINANILRDAHRYIIYHHDSLRINVNDDHFYYQDMEIVNQINIENITLNPADLQSDLVEKCVKIKKSFDISKGLLIKAAIMNVKDQLPFLFLTAHHLVVDGMSWRVLLEDLQRAIDALEARENVNLPAKTASLKHWYKQVTAYKTSDRFIAQHQYWADLFKYPFALPYDKRSDDWSVKNRRKCTANLSQVDTLYLLREGNRVYQTDALILLSTALALSLNNWLRRETFIVHFENHGRHVEEIDISRTVGWFTALFPVKLSLPSDTLDGQIRSVKEQLRNIPDHGIGYGVHLLNGNLLASPGPVEIIFNYLGEFGNEMDNNMFSYSPYYTGEDIDPANAMSSKIEINLMVIKEKLCIDILYNHQVHATSTITAFLNSMTDNLSQIIEHLKSKGNEIHFTSSDFSAVDLSADELNELF
jgi:amino acid adenylation domain-containing protein/non-ribosomal peptide synthase protein (TIGR01720 family)